MGLVILWQQPDGRLAVTTPVALPLADGEAEADALLRHAEQVLPKGVAVALADRASLPSDRTWRDAWIANLDGATPPAERAVTVDIERAREVHRARLRLARAPLLAALDTDFLRAVETGDTTEQQRIAARKQALRAAPAAKGIADAASAAALLTSIDDATLRQRYEQLLPRTQETR